jgi:hypothetical protein
MEMQNILCVSMYLARHKSALFIKCESELSLRSITFLLKRFGFVKTIFNGNEVIIIDRDGLMESIIREILYRLDAYYRVINHKDQTSILSPRTDFF